VRDSDHLGQLNPEQRDAVLTVNGPLLVLAGAGSGKTRTIVHRIAHLIADHGISPRRILGVTFTNRAADEMRERVRALAGKAARGITLSTFHSVGAGILRRHGEAIGVQPDFAIHTAGDQVATVRRILSEEVRIVAPTDGEERYDAKRVLARISDWKSRMVTPEEARAEVIASAQEGTRDDDYEILAADVYPRYEEALRAAGVCDFDDLLLLPVRLLRDHSEARDACWRRWHYLLVDEYQDTNAAQLEMARMLAGPRRNLCVVGDDDQSIYAWRGADVRNILDFERHYPDARLVALERNYRSTKRILDAANAVIRHNTGRHDKTLKTDSPPGPRIDYWEFAGAGNGGPEAAEAAMVAREIGLRRFQQKLAWADFAVLYRTNLQARPLEEAMRAANIPYRVVGGTSYFDRKEIADAVAYLRAVANPADETSIRRIANYPSRGIGRTTLLRLVEDARGSARTLWETMSRVDQVEGIAEPQRRAVSEFVQLVEQARAGYREARASLIDGDRGYPLREWAGGFLDRIGLESAIRMEHGDGRSADIRVGNVRALLDSLAYYEDDVRAPAELPDQEEDADPGPPPGLGGFLERISLVDPADERRKDEEEPEDDRVTLLTLHSAKGLEFPHVFLVGLEEEILPHVRSIGNDEAASLEALAEERRLLYVGITRARHRLTLSACRERTRGSERIPREPSRFLQEIPRELLTVHAEGVESSLNAEERQELKENFFSRMREMLAE
jgi:DNA helicase II / ATP-dependent DNA helicase PcrA